MNKLLFLLIFIISISLQAQKKPKLIVGIVVDQMKMEYLYRFSDDFSENGFKRLMKDGYTFHNMHYNFVPTYTAPGHASIYTGTTPSTHGIVGNDWFNKATGKDMYCVGDKNVSSKSTQFPTVVGQTYYIRVFAPFSDEGLGLIELIEPIVLSIHFSCSNISLSLLCILFFSAYSL